MKNWYSIKNRAESVIDLSIHDEIGTWGVSAYDFLNELDNHKSAQVINLSINSPGGNLLDGLAIYNALIDHPAQVNGKVVALAGSAASFILMAADHAQMPENSIFFIHKAQGGAQGEADDLRELADVMDMYEDMIVNIYLKKASITEDKVRQLLKEAKPIKAYDAMSYGFINQVGDAIDVAANVSGFEKYVPGIEASNDTSDIHTQRDFEKRLRDSGVSMGLATALTSRAKVVFQGEPESASAELTQLSERLANFKI